MSFELSYNEDSLSFNFPRISILFLDSVLGSALDDPCDSFSFTSFFSINGLFLASSSKFLCLNSRNDGIGTLARGYFSLALLTAIGKLSRLISRATFGVVCLVPSSISDNERVRLNVDERSRVVFVDVRSESLFFVKSELCVGLCWVDELFVGFFTGDDELSITLRSEWSEFGLPWRLFSGSEIPRRFSDSRLELRSHLRRPIALLLSTDDTPMML